VTTDQVVIRVENLGKLYRIGQRGTHADDLRHRLNSVLTYPFRKLWSGAKSNEPGAGSEERRAGGEASRAGSKEQGAETETHDEPSTTHQAPRTKHQAPSTKHQAPSTKHQAPSTKHSTSATTRNQQAMNNTLSGACQIHEAWVKQVKGPSTLLPVCSDVPKIGAWHDE